MIIPGVGAVPTGDTPDMGPRRRAFMDRYADWRLATVGMQPLDAVDHPTARALLAAPGPLAPLLFSYLEAGRAFPLPALIRRYLGAGPEVAPLTARGADALIDAWLEWGRERGYLDPPEADDSP